MAKSLVDLAFDYVVSKGAECDFEEIWAYVCEQRGIDVNNVAKKAQFYSTLFIDGRLFLNDEKLWNLKSFQTIADKEKKSSHGDYDEEVSSEERDPEESEEIDFEDDEETSEEDGEETTTEEEF